MSKKVDHIHKFHRIYLSSREVIKDKEGKRHLVEKPKHEVWKCGVPGCPTFKDRALVLGNLSQCWVCGDALILDSENMKLVRPTHVWCRKIREIA